MQSMPIENNSVTDRISGMIVFRESSLWEFLSSIEAAVHSWRFNSWTGDVTKALGESFLPILGKLVPGYTNSLFFSELAVDAPDQKDIEGFFDYVEALSTEDFIYYSFGRVIPREMIQLDSKPQKMAEIKNILNDYLCSSYPEITPEELDWLNNPNEKRNELLTVWKHYYYDFYIHQNTDFSDEYRSKFKEWGHVLENRGGMALYTYVRNSDWFPPNLPEDQDYTRIEIIPVHRMPRRHRTYYGYGKITVLSPSMETPETQQNKQELKSDLIHVMKAMGDDSRLEILRLIVESEYGMNQKSIAEKLSISPSVVSRHLKQLKQADIIKDRTIDNRNFSYAINIEMIRQINRKLLYFLTDNNE